MSLRKINQVFSYQDLAVGNSLSHGLTPSTYVKKRHLLYTLCNKSDASGGCKIRIILYSQCVKALSREEGEHLFLPEVFNYYSSTGTRLPLKLPVRKKELLVFISIPDVS